MGVLDRVRESVEDFTGLRIVDRQAVVSLEESAQRWSEFASEAEDLAMGVMDYLSGRPTEVRHEVRKSLAQRSRIALLQDPLAGAEVEHRANFALGRGISKPKAAHDEVQTIIDEAWEDPVNAAKLTSYSAQRKLSNNLWTAANAYLAYFENADAGKIRVGWVNPDNIEDIVTDPEDDERPLYYVCRKERRTWDFETHSLKVETNYTEEGSYKTWYYAHWRNVEDFEEEKGYRKEPPKDPGKPADPEFGKPKPSDLADGKIEHFAINLVGRTLFGTPPWARSLRFFSAMNQFSEARVAMAQASASIIAKRVRRGGPSDLLKAASNVASQFGELATARFGGEGYRLPASPIGPGTNPSRGQAPMPAGSWWTENESDRLEAVRLSSGSGEAAQDAQILRAPISAAAGLGQHYLGDASNANLSTAVSLELPALMMVNAWQEMLEAILRFFIDRAIETAVRSGRLGGMALTEEEKIEWGVDGRKPLNKLRLSEDREEMEKRTKKDLSYELEMPYPGRRNLPEVIAAATQLATAFDPTGTNHPLRRQLLTDVFRHGYQVEDPSRLVDELWPEDGPVKPEPEVDPNAPPVDPNADPEEQPAQIGSDVPPEMAARLAALLGRPAAGGGDGSGAAKRGEAPATGARTGKVPKGRQGLAESAVTPGNQDVVIRKVLANVDREFQAILDDPETVLAGKPVRRNGNGSAPSGRH